MIILVKMKRKRGQTDVDAAGTRVSLKYAGHRRQYVSMQVRVSAWDPDDNKTNRPLDKDENPDCSPSVWRRRDASQDLSIYSSTSLGSPERNSKPSSAVAAAAAARSRKERSFLFRSSVKTAGVTVYQLPFIALWLRYKYTARKARTPLVRSAADLLWIACGTTSCKTNQHQIEPMEFEP